MIDPLRSIISCLLSLPSPTAAPSSHPFVTGVVKTAEPENNNTRESKKNKEKNDTKKHRQLGDSQGEKSFWTLGEHSHKILHGSFRTSPSPRLPAAGTDCGPTWSKITNCCTNLLKEHLLRNIPLSSSRGSALKSHSQEDHSKCFLFKAAFWALEVFMVQSRRTFTWMGFLSSIYN